MVNGLISVLMNTAVVIKAGLMLYSVAKTVAITAVGVADSAIIACCAVPCKPNNQAKTNAKAGDTINRIPVDRDNACIPLYH